MFAGFSRIIVVVGILAVIGVTCYATKKGRNFNLDPGGVRGAFDPFLAKYLRLGEFMIGLATGSIVLLVGSSAFHGQGGRLPWFYASPLLLLAASVLFGLLFMAWLILNYEEYSHGTPHTGLHYSLSLTLGFSAIAYFCVGYLWLIVAVTR
jgi:hypothetical protein